MQLESRYLPPVPKTKQEWIYRRYNREKQSGNKWFSGYVNKTTFYFHFSSLKEKCTFFFYSVFPVICCVLVSSNGYFWKYLLCNSVEELQLCLTQWVFYGIYCKILGTENVIRSYRLTFFFPYVQTAIGTTRLSHLQKKKYDFPSGCSSSI